MLKRQKTMGWWLLILASLIALMIVLGGYTRLSGSGLSIVEWRPITGVFFPLSENSWLTEFAKYKGSPEYQLINFTMDLADFKRIYFVEYSHRMLGRIIGITFLLPYLYFLYRKSLKVKELSYPLIFVLICLQGLAGWLMVHSGLINAPHVDHFRLAIHLVFGLAIFGYCFALAIKNIFNLSYLKLNKYDWSVLSLLFMQIFYGGLVAGLHAGLLYNEFPCMGESIVPVEWAHSKDVFKKIFFEPAIVQFVHRCLATLVLIVFCSYGYKSFFYTRSKNASTLLILLTLSQYILGIATILMQVELKIALIHQLFAILITANLIFLIIIKIKQKNELL